MLGIVHEMGTVLETNNGIRVWINLSAPGGPNPEISPTLEGIMIPRYFR